MRRRSRWQTSRAVIEAVGEGVVEFLMERVKDEAKGRLLYPGLNR